MSYLQGFTCVKLEHEGQEILGFCLNLDCNQGSQCCVKCMQNPEIHKNCKLHIKQFRDLPTIPEQLIQLINEKQKKLNQVNEQVNVLLQKTQKEYQACKDLLENMKISSKNICQYLELQDYQQIKDNISTIKQAYDYLKNQDIENKQNETSSKLNKVKKFIESFDIGQGFKQNYEDVLKQTINLLNQQKWQQAKELLEVNTKKAELLVEHAKKAEQFISYAKFYQSIALIELNNPGKGMMIREEAKNLNEKLFSELLEYANKELQENNKNIFMQITKSYALCEEKQYDQALECCQQVLNENPSHLHALIRASITLQNQKKIQEAILKIDNAMVFSNQKYCIGHFYKAFHLQLQGKYKDAILIYNKALDQDENFAQAYNNKGLCLDNMKNYYDAIKCFDKAIEIGFCNAIVFSNKGQLLEKIDQKDQALINYNQAIILDKTLPKVYKQKGYLLISMKRFKEAVQTYDQAIKYCIESEQESFFNLRNEYIKKI